MPALPAGTVTFLSGMPLFEGLTAEQLAKLSGLLHTRTFPGASNVIIAEQPGEAVYVIQSGAVKIYVEEADGTDVILAILCAGEVLGEMSIADSLGRSANVVTLEESTLLWMDRATFQHCLRTMPAMNANLVRILSRRLRLANAHIQALAALDVDGRVARQILVFAGEYGGTMPNGDVVIPLPLTQSDLAGLVGASRVRVNQVLVHYRERGYISVDQHHRITVHNREALARRCM
jgi:CRP/FNR family cyclic AMP-dependent transcriptional regulator